MSASRHVGTARANLGFLRCGEVDEDLPGFEGRKGSIAAFKYSVGLRVDEAVCTHAPAMGKWRDAVQRDTKGETTHAKSHVWLMTMPPMARQFQSLLVGLVTLKPLLLLLSVSVAVTSTFRWPLAGRRSEPRWNPPMRSTASQMSRSPSLRVVHAKTWRRHDNACKGIPWNMKTAHVAAFDKRVAAPSLGHNCGE